MKKRKRANPLWETIVLFSSFVLLWIWFLASQAARHSPEGKLSPLWQFVLAGALIVLIVITVRRMNRVRRAFSGEDQDDDPEHPQGTPPFFPNLPPEPNKRG